MRVYLKRTIGFFEAFFRTLVKYPLCRFLGQSRFVIMQAYIKKGIKGDQSNGAQVQTFKGL